MPLVRSYTHFRILVQSLKEMNQSGVEMPNLSCERLQGRQLDRIIISQGRQVFNILYE
jgi:hypothetical protein